MKTFKHFVAGLMLVGMLSGNVAATRSDDLRALAQKVSSCQGTSFKFEGQDKNLARESGIDLPTRGSFANKIKSADFQNVAARLEAEAARLDAEDASLDDIVAVPMDIEVPADIDMEENRQGEDMNPQVAENPVVENPVVENPVEENPVVENPVVENPVAENPVAVKLENVKAEDANVVPNNPQGDGQEAESRFGVALPVAGVFAVTTPLASGAAFPLVNQSLHAFISCLSAYRATDIVQRQVQENIFLSQIPVMTVEGIALALGCVAGGIATGIAYKIIKKRKEKPATEDVCQPEAKKQRQHGPDEDEDQNGKQEDVKAEKWAGFFNFRSNLFGK